MPILGWLLLGSVAFGLLGTGIQTFRLDSSQKALLALEKAEAVEAARSAQEVASKKEADAEKTRALAEQGEQIKTAVKDQINASVSTFARVASNPACVGTPAARQFDLGLRPPAPGR